ncbi:MAG: type II CRISPR-associated endonuclease Cas1 [Ignavibacteria bacterium]|jgi:CRISPR-associated protein Cas1|nr:type II CRISPR-associated endonuclease Cas1 [Ignavibacteria bacterium]
MLKQTLYFGNPAYLSVKNKQLVVKLIDSDEIITRPIEDIGIVILDNWQITITQNVIASLLENNAAIIHCNNAHLPVGLVLNLDGNTLQSQRFKTQINASEPLKKQLWQQIIKAKIENQSLLLKSQNKDIKRLQVMLRNLKTGDTDNYEAQAAAYYWKNIFSNYLPNFKRDREGDQPNNLLNYGYAILRAAVARALVGSGLLPTLGIFHRNQYNAYCLADDIMEPYRPFVDRAVFNYLKENKYCDFLDTEAKKYLFQVMQDDVMFGKERSPLFVGLTTTTASLVACFEGKKRKIKYPTIC